MHRKDLNIKNKVYIYITKSYINNWNKLALYFMISHTKSILINVYFKNGKKVLQFVMWNNFPSFLTCIFLYFCPSLLANSHILRSVWWPPTDPRTVTHARDHAFVSPGVNSRAELVPSHRTYARNGTPRRWLGDYIALHYFAVLKHASGCLQRFLALWIYCLH
jgi:hypothetical protein